MPVFLREGGLRQHRLEKERDDARRQADRLREELSRLRKEREKILRSQDRR
jgi:hypothetical protein